jgi:hypothetical protein
MKEYLRKPAASFFFTILFSVWVGVIFYNHYPRLWQAIRDPFAAAETIPSRYMNLGVVGIGLLLLAVLVSHFGIAYLLSVRLNTRLKGYLRLAVSILAVGLVLGLAWSLYHYPKLLDAGVSLALLLMIILISSFAGRKSLHALGLKSNSFLEEFVFSAGLGLGLFAYAILALACLGLLHAWLVWLIFVVLGIGLFRDIWCSIKNLGKRLGGLFSAGFSVKNRAADILLISLISIYLLVNLIGALAPEIEPDALVYHLYVPRIYVQNHRLVHIPYEFRSAFPLGIEMLFTLGMLLSTSALAKLIHFSLGVLSLLATYCFGRKYLTDKVALLAAALFYTIPVVSWESTTAYIDLGFALFTALEIFALVNWMCSSQQKWLLMASIMCGFAMGTKYYGLFGLILLLIGIAFKFYFVDKGRTLLVLKTLVIYGSVSLLIVSPWLIKNHVFTGNPVYPFLNNIFKSPLMPPINPTFDRASFGIGDDVFSRYILSPWNITFHGEKYGGVISPIFLIFLPLLFVIRVEKVIKYALLFCGVYFVLWVISFPVMRYLIPIMPFLSIVVSYVITGMVSWDHIGNKVLSAGVITGIATALFLNLPFFHPLWQEEWIPGVVRHIPFEVVLGLESREDYLSRYLDSYAVIEYINQNLSKSARVLSFWEENQYYFDRELIYNYSFQGSECIYETQTEAGFLYCIKGLKITHLLINRNRIPSNQAQLLVLQKPFVRQYLQLIYSQKNVDLYEVIYEDEDPHQVSLDEERNLIDNHSFEVDNGGVPYQWLVYGDPIYDRSGTRSHTGNSAVLADEQNGYVFKVPVSELTTYTLSHYAKGDVGGEKGRLQINWLDDSDRIVDVSILVFTATTEYTWRSMTVTAPKGATIADVYVSSCSVEDKIWYDDYELKRIEVAP